MKKILFLVFTSLVFTFSASAVEKNKHVVKQQQKQVSSKHFQVLKDGSVHIEGLSFKSLEDYVSSNYFKETGKRCGTETLPLDTRKAMSDGTDCTLSSTTIKSEYNLSDYIIIPVVFHVIYKTDGTGNVSDELILSQIESMNMAYGADPSFTNGSTDTHIEFELAGITRTQNDDWFNDSNELAYKSALGWDQDSYLNIYTNTASGYLGYSYLPQNMAGGIRDGVVLNSEAVGQLTGWQYDEGDTLNHEIGHYLGLLHTFQDGCVSNTYFTGDLIVDTNAQASGNNIYDCTDISSCGTPDPIHNYMNYTDDACLYQFTAEQSNRMICSILNYRSTLYHNKVDGLPEFSSFTATPSSTDLSVTFNATATDPDSGSIVSYKWDFDNDGEIDQTTSAGNSSYTYPAAGKYSASVTAVDSGSQERKSWIIEVNSGTGTAPTDTYTKHLYIPLSQTNTSFTSYLGLYNPGDETTNYTINFVGENGYVVASSVNGTINTLSRKYEEALSTNVDNAYWIMIGYDNTLDAYLELISDDGSKSGAILASKKLDDKLYVPHIAPETNYWNSYSSIVNGTNSPITATFNYLTGTMPLNPPADAFSMNYFEWYDDLFASGAPTGFKYWGIVESASSSLFGMEMFSTKGELDTLGALDLNSNSSDTLYFAHVDVGGGYWWTGVVIENINSSQITIEITPYDVAGNALTPVSYTMDGYEKLVNVIQGFWTNKSLTYPENTAWFKVVATGGEIIGYELFGTEESAGRKLLAGINAATDGKLKLTYPHVDVSTTSWTGITVVNIGDDTTSLTAKAYDNNGNLLQEYPVKTSFAPNEKYVNVAENIFSGGLPIGTTVITMESDNSLVGFEIWGDMPQTRISGILPFTPTSGDYVYFESFEASEYIESSIVPDGWNIYALSQNTSENAGWASASAFSFTDGDWLTNYSQSIPDGNDYMVGFYGSQTERNHQLLTSPAITLPAGITTLEFMSQFGWPGDATKSCNLYIYVGSDTPDLSVATKVHEFTKSYMQIIDTSSEVNSFTVWRPESFDISSFAGQTIRICFEINSQWEQSWHIDSLGIK